MNEMVDRVARAMCKGFKLNCVNTGCREVCLQTFDPRDALMVEAKAAIAAMRQPTETMIKATEGKTGGYGYGDECFPADPVEVWQAMIDEALK